MRDSRFPPGFMASLLGAAAGFIGGAFLTAILAAPFALASASTLAFGGVSSEDEFARRFVVVVFLLIAVQLLASAWIAQQTASLVGDGVVRFWRAVGALFLGGLATLVAALALPADAALPVVGHSWVGILVAAWVISSGPRAAEAH